MPATHHPLRESFEQAADGYEAARPAYPGSLLDHLIEYAQLEAGARLLEIGPASGKATRPLAERGFAITAIELGEGLARNARAALSSFPDVTILHADFDCWEPPDHARFDLVFAATAWHWLDPTGRCEKAWRVLRPGGHLAVWSAAHVFPDGGDPIFAELQPTYDAIGEGLPEGRAWPRPGELPAHDLTTESEGRFETVQVAHFDWETVHDAESYIALLDTFSGHRTMSAAKRERLDREIRRRLANRADGQLRRHWGAVLEIARRRDAER